MVYQRFPITVTKTLGSHVWSTCGKYLDFTSGIATVNTGHRHPEVIKAIQKQLQISMHVAQHVYGSALRQNTTQRLLSHAPHLDRCVFSCSGSEAVENALKIARSSTNRHAVVSFEGGHHGRTSGALSVTNSRSEFKRNLSAMTAGVFTVQYPTNHGAAHDLDRIFRQTCPSANVAAVIIEPVLGEGGYITCPTAYFRELHSVCRAHGVLLIADEVQCGIARTGSFFAYQHTGVRPDIITCGKGLASGMPLSAVLFSSSLDVPEHILGGTFGGNELSLAAANATMDIISQMQLDEQAVHKGDVIRTRVLHACAHHDIPVTTTGRGLMIGVHFENVRVQRVLMEMFRRNVLVLPCGTNGLRLAPPLTVTDAEINHFAIAFESALSTLKSPPDVRPCTRVKKMCTYINDT